jgi:hypothetical protein
MGACDQAGGARNRAKPLRDKSTIHIFADSTYSRAREDTAWIDPV